MRSHRRMTFLIFGLVFLAAGCDNGGIDTPGSEISDEQLIPQINTWLNQLGLAQTNPDVWRERLERACTEGVWTDEVATQLAQEFIDEDLAVSVRAEGLGPPSVESGAQALWLMAMNVCRDAFPDGEIEKGAAVS